MCREPDLFLDVPVLMDVLGHQVEELVEADASVPILVDLANHLLEEAKTVSGLLSLFEFESFSSSRTKDTRLLCY